MDNIPVPARNTVDDILDAAAREIAAEVVAHIEAMYPAAANAVAWKSCARSIQGVIRNRMKVLGAAAEAGTFEDTVKRSSANRAKFRRLMKAARMTEDYGDCVRNMRGATERDGGIK